MGEKEVAVVNEVVELLRTEIGGQLMVPDRALHVGWDRDAACRAYGITVIVEGLGRPYSRVRYPANWWAAWKERWLPEWLKRRWPVEYEEHVCERFCPHGEPSKEGTHDEWLRGA